MRSEANYQKSRLVTQYNNISEWVSSIPSKWWLLICFVGFILAQILIHPDILKVTYFYSEDGTVFFNGAKDGFTAFLTPWGGYLVTLSRLITGVAYLVMLATNSILAAGETIEILSMISVALICCYFASDEFSYLIKSRGKRLTIMILLILLMSNFVSMFYNTVDLHWWCGIFAFFVSLNLVHGKPIKWQLVPFIVIAILSSPSTFFIIFPCFYNIIVYGWKNQKYKSIAILLPLFVQAYFVLFVPSSLADSDTQSLVISGVSFSMSKLSNFMRTILNTPCFVLGAKACATPYHFNMTVYYTVFAWVISASAAFLTLAIAPFTHSKNKKSHKTFLRYTWIIFAILTVYCAVAFRSISMLILIVFIFRNRKNATFLKECILTLTVASSIYGMTMLKNHGMSVDDQSSFYYSTIAGVTFIFFAIQLCRIKKYTFLPYVIAPVLAVIYMVSTLPIDLSPNQRLVDADQYIDVGSKVTTRVCITPCEGYWKGKWYVEVPVNEEYIEHDNTEESPQ